LGFLHLLELVRLAVIGRTEPKLGTSTRGKSVEYVLGMFVVDPLVQNEKQSPMPDVGVHIDLDGTTRRVGFVRTGPTFEIFAERKTAALTTKVRLPTLP
jgi:hypothetical protein